SDAGREDDRIDSAERGRERAELTPDAIEIEIDGELCARLIARQQRAHVARDAGHTEQARLIVDELLDCACVHAALIHEIEDDTRVERAAARTHRQAFHGGETHRAGHALARLHPAHAG